MNWKLLLLLFIILFFTLVGYLSYSNKQLNYPNFFNQPQLKIINVEDKLNLKFEPIIDNKIINLKQIPIQLKKSYTVNLEITPMLVTNSFTSFATTVYEPKHINLSAVDATVDKQNHIIHITIHINTDYLKEKSDLTRETNIYFLTGLLYAQSQIENQTMTPQLHKTIVDGGINIYTNLKLNSRYIIQYE